MVAGHTHQIAELGIGHHVPILAVDRNEVLRVGDGQVGLEFVGLRMAGGMHVGNAGVDHFHTGTQQIVDDSVHIAFVAGDGMAAEHHRVVLADLHPLALATRQQREGRHRLALRTGGHDAHLFGLVLVGLFDVDQRGIRNPQHAEVSSHAHVLLHAQTERGNHSTIRDGSIGDLLNAVQVAGEAGRDDAAALLLTEHTAQHRTHARLARSMSVLLGVRAVGEQQTNALGGGDGADATEVGATTIHRGEVELEVAGVQDDTLRGVQGDGVRVRNRVRDGDELHVERTDHPPLAVAHHNQVGLSEQASFFNSVTRQTQRDSRAVDGEAQLTQQILQCADVVFVAMSGHHGHDVVGALAQPREVGQHKVDAMHVGVGEHEAAVDEKDLALLLDGHAVAADLTETAEEDDAYGSSHHRPRRARRFAIT